MDTFETYSPTLTEHLRKEPPRLLFHYTSPAGLIGIISSKEMWATNTRFLNDSQEIREALDLVNSITEGLYQNLLKNGSSEPYELEFVTKMKERLIHVSERYYVISFTELADSLSQWRAYCPPKGGYALGLPSNHLRAICGEQKFVLAKCIYDPNVQRKIVLEILYSFLTKFIEFKKSGGNSVSEISLLNNFVSHFTHIGAIIKNKGFKEEEEWRIVSEFIVEMDNQYVGFREANGKIVPYYRFQLGTENHPFGAYLSDGSSLDLVVGPNVDQRSAILAAHMCFLRYLGSDFSSTQSETPYRTW